MWSWFHSVFTPGTPGVKMYTSNTWWHTCSDFQIVTHWTRSPTATHTLSLQPFPCLFSHRPAQHYRFQYSNFQSLPRELKKFRKSWQLLATRGWKHGHFQLKYEDSHFNRTSVRPCNYARAGACRVVRAGWWKNITYEMHTMNPQRQCWEAFTLREYLTDQEAATELPVPRSGSQDTHFVALLLKQHNLLCIPSSIATLTCPFSPSPTIAFRKRKGGGLFYFILF